MAIKVLVTSQKGGVGKSTLSANLAAYLSLHGGMRTALLDFDHQATSSTWLRRCGDSRVRVFPVDILSLTSSGLSVLKSKEALRVACLDTDVVISDLTWVDTLPPSFFLDYDLILIPASLSGIELDSLHDFFERFANIFNSVRQRVPQIVVAPNRLNDIDHYNEIFSESGFPVRFHLLSPIMYSKAAQDCFGKRFLFSTVDLSLRNAFLQVCTEVKQILEPLMLRASQGVTVQRQGLSPHKVKQSVLDRFVAGRAVRNRGGPLATEPDEKKWFEFLRRKSR